MASFDISKNWVILADLPAWDAAIELARYVSLLRENAGARGQLPQINEAETALLGSAPVILLNAPKNTPDKNGFAWQFSADRVEISGDSIRGLWNGIFDFLAALGVKWPQPGQEELPQAAPKDSSAPDVIAYTLNKDAEHCPSNTSPRERRRIFISEKTGEKERENLVKWAVRNKYDALVFSLKEKTFWATAGEKDSLYNTEKFALIIEAGGRDLSLLLSRRHFFFNRDLFRMESGERTSKHHFCPTNPKTIARITKQAKRLFRQTLAGVTFPRVFHLLPDLGHENSWCACPACRAFNPAEQNMIAVKSAAPELAGLDPLALLSFFDFGAAKDESTNSEIVPEKNMFILSPCKMIQF